MSDKVQCPNCQSEAERSGNKIICVACDATFEIKKTGAAHVVKLGQVEALEGRVGALEALLNPKPEGEEPETEEEEDIL